jgi:tetratricopeptide (TPR) repeat protein
VLAEIQLARWNVAEAERSLDRAASLDSGSAAVFQLHSFMHAWRGEHEAALASAKRALALAPTDTAAHGLLANALALAGDFANAVASYSEILDVDPTCRIARQGRCEVYAAEGRFDLALDDLDQLPHTPANLSRRACIRAYLGDRLSAIRLFRELQRLSASRIVECHSIAQLHIALGRPDEGLRLIQRAIETHDLAFPAMLSSPLMYVPMQDRKVHQMFADVRNSLCRPRKKIG